MDYYTMTTDDGDQAIAQAIQSGTTTTFQSLAVGDSNGTYYDPAKTATALRHEVWRGNAVVTLDPNNTKRVIVTATIPAAVGGFTVREAGIFDTAGKLMVIAKLPLSEKVDPSSGASSDLLIRLYIEVSDAGAVTVTVDPSAILATKADVNEVAAELDAHEVDQTVHMTTLSCAKSGTIYALTGLTATSGKVPVMFSVPTAFVAGDTVTIDGTAYTLATTDNSALTPGAWAAGAIITGMADVDAKTLTVAPSGHMHWFTTAASVGDSGDFHVLNTPHGFVFSEGCQVTFKTLKDAIGEGDLDGIWDGIQIGGVSYALRTWTGKAITSSAYKAGAVITVTLSSQIVEIVSGNGDGRQGTAYINFVRDAPHALSADTASGTVALATPGLRNIVYNTTPSSGYLGDGVLELIPK